MLYTLLYKIYCVYIYHAYTAIQKFEDTLSLVLVVNNKILNDVCLYINKILCCINHYCVIQFIILILKEI